MLDFHRIRSLQVNMQLRNALPLGPFLIALASAGISHALDHFASLLGSPFTIALLCLSVPLLIIGIILRRRQPQQSNTDGVSASISVLDQSSVGSLNADISSNQLVAVVGDRNVVTLAQPAAVADPHFRDYDLLHDRLKSAKTLVDSGRHQAAIDTLTRLRKEATDESLPAEFHATLANRIGVAYLGLNRLDDAESELQTAIRIVPNHPKAVVNLASLRIHQEKAAEALSLTDCLVDEIPDNPAIAAIRIQALYLLRRQYQIEEFVAHFAEIVATPTVMATLARIRLSDDDPDAAVSLARDVLAAEPGETSHKHLLGQCLLRSVVKAVGGDPPVPWLLESRLRDQVEEALSLLTEAIGVMEQREEPEPLRSALLNRAHSRMILQRLDAALDDCRRARRIGPDDDHLRELMARILLQLGRPLEAQHLLSAIQNQDVRAKLLPQQASALIGDSKLQDAIDLLRPVWDTAPEDSLPLDICSMLVDAYITAENHEEASAVLARLQSNRAADGQVLAIAARFAARTAQTDEATRLFEKAFHNADENEKDWIALEFADYLCANGEFSRSVELYDGRVPIDRPSPFLRNYLASLWN